MNCYLEDIPNSVDSRGWRRVRCVRSTCEWRRGINPTPDSFDNIHVECTGWPRWHEWGHWLWLVTTACFINQRDIAWLNWRLGLTEVPECGCGDRQQWLNTLGGRACQSSHWLAKAFVRWCVRRAPSQAQDPAA